MPRYPSRPFWHPKQIMATLPFCYPVITVSIGLCMIWPFRYKISRYYERQTDTAAQALKGKAVRLYREIERMHRREMTLGRNPATEQILGTQMSLPAQMISFQRGQTDAEYQYWESHQKDVMRARRLQQEIEDLKARVAAPAK